MEVAIAGGGVGGLTLALHQRGVPCRVYKRIAGFAPPDVVPRRA